MMAPLSVNLIVLCYVIKADSPTNGSKGGLSTVARGFIVHRGFTGLFTDTSEYIGSTFSSTLSHFLVVGSVL